MKGKKKIKLFAIFVILAQVIALVISKFSSRKNVGKNVEKIIKKQVTQVKNSRLKDFFIPHEGNDHKPHSVRTKALAAYLLVAVLIKATATISLYLIYPSPAEMSALVASKMLELTNTSRQELGIEPLRLDPVLTQAAFEKAQDMIARDYFSHDTPEGKKPWKWINSGEYDYVYAGENLAMGFNSAEFVQAAFLESPSHRKNILNARYIDVGFAVVNGVINGRTTDILVEMFGTRRSDLTLAQAAPIPSVTPTVLAAQETVVQEPVTQEIVVQEQGAKPEITPETFGTTVAANEIGPAPPSEGVIFVVGQTSKRSIIDIIIAYTNILFIAFIIFIVTSLLLNIFIKFKVQHTHLIMQSLVVLALLASLILTKLHFVEKIAPQLFIL